MAKVKEEIKEVLVKNILGGTIVTDFGTYNAGDIFKLEEEKAKTLLEMPYFEEVKLV